MGSRSRQLEPPLPSIAVPRGPWSHRGETFRAPRMWLHGPPTISALRGAGAPAHSAGGGCSQAEDGSSARGMRPLLRDQVQAGWLGWEQKYEPLKYFVFRGRPFCWLEWRQDPARPGLRSRVARRETAQEEAPSEPLSGQAAHPPRRIPGPELPDKVEIHSRRGNPSPVHHPLGRRVAAGSPQPGAH